MYKLNFRKLTLMFIDAFTIIVSSAFALFTLKELGSLSTISILDIFPSIFVLAVISTISMIGCGVYKNIWRYAQLSDFIKCVAGIIIGTAISYVLCDVLPYISSHLFTVFSALLSLCAIIVLRAAYSWLYSFTQKNPAAQKIPTLIVGAGSAGHRLVSELSEQSSEYTPVGVVDDDKLKHGLFVKGIKILGTSKDIPKICEKHNVKTIIIAIPTLEGENKKRLYDICTKAKCELKTLPNIKSLESNKALFNQTKQVRVEDLLSRDVITFDNKETAALVNGRICMVTGGGGSIGSELCRQIAKYKPRKLIIFDIYENNAYEIEQELKREYGKTLDLHIEIGSVRDYQKLDCVYSQYKPQLVFHAAAHKHVPLMETNPEEAVKNNIIGTFNATTLAELYKVERFILISTDKAVNPTNIMGATKRCCEMIVQNMAQHSTVTNFITVRFGNVLGSNGSVIPLFEKQFAEGGPLTVTHPDVTRFFMTIPEAVSLILQAAANANGGEIFVLDMGKPVKIVSLAENLIRLHGKEPYKDIDIKFTGLRPGEKLYEELLMDEEGLTSTDNKKIFIGKQIFVDEDKFMFMLSKIKNLAQNNDKESVVELLAEIVPTFDHHPNN